MKARDYYFGQHVTLRSPLKPDEIAQRIKDDTKDQWWWMPLRTGPVGRVRWGRLSLAYRSSPFEYNAKPVLVGPIERTMTGTIMRLTYRGPTWSRIFYAFWYVILTLFAIGFAVAGTDPPLHGAERLMPLGIVAAMMLMPVAMHVIGTRRSDDELEELIDFLGRVAEAKPSGE